MKVMVIFKASAASEGGQMDTEGFEATGLQSGLMAENKVWIRQPNGTPRISADFRRRYLSDPADRSRYLDKVCDDPVQRARVESLLTSHDSAGSFLGTPAVALAWRSAAGMGRCVTV